MPKISTETWRAHAGGPHAVTGVDYGPYADQALGDAIGLTQFGVRLESLPPGSRSAHRHWHEAEDEFVFVVSGRVVLIEDEEVELQAGEAAGWAAGVPVGHCFENRSAAEVVLLVVGTRSDKDVVHYPDHDLVLRREGATQVFQRADGTPVAEAQ